MFWVIYFHKINYFLLLASEGDSTLADKETALVFCSIIIPILDIWTLPIKGIAEYHKSRALFGRKSPKKFIFQPDLVKVFSSSLYEGKNWLSCRENDFGRLVFAFCRFVSVLSVFGREKLHELSLEASNLLENTLCLKKEAKEMTHFCTLMSLNRFSYSTSRKRQRKRVLFSNENEANNENENDGDFGNIEERAEEEVEGDELDETDGQGMTPRNT